MTIETYEETLARIRYALEAAAHAISSFVPDSITVEYKADGDPVTEVDRTANRVLREALIRDGDGWLSEESADDLTRLKSDRIWVVDPLDGTREFVAGIPEWCISVGLVENKRAVAGGICNPATGEMFLGALGCGISLNGNILRPKYHESVSEAIVLASRTEVERGMWDSFLSAPFEVRPMGSVAYKLALVASGLADAVCSFSPKHEWDVAAGVALVEAAGGFVEGLEGSPLRWNNASTLLAGLLAGGQSMRCELTFWLRDVGHARRGCSMMRS